MPVIQAKSAGFCYGVRRAVELAEKTARENGGCVMLGSIIHNANVVARLEQLGFHSLAQLAEAETGDVVSQASAMLGSSCWRNSPQARAAISGAIAAARAVGAA